MTTPAFSKNTSNVHTFLQARFVGALVAVVLFLIYFLQLPKDINDDTIKSSNLKNPLNSIVSEDYSEEKVKRLNKSLKDTRQELLDTRSDLEKTTKLLHELYQQRKKDKEEGNTDNNKENIALKNQIDRYVVAIQSISKRHAIEKFGPGPHRVEITLDFPPEAPFSRDNINPKFVIELAHLDLMPHTVYHFLMQVHNGCWNGRSFNRNAEHVLQAGLEGYYATADDADDDGGFDELGLTEVGFQEYSDMYPHELHTVGFAGRPGGPEWYISMMDNTEIHGPGGQNKYELKHEADPCFGKVVQGLEAVYLMQKMPKESDDFESMKYNVGIKKAKIL